jgi:hypothetical protein
MPLPLGDCQLLHHLRLSSFYLQPGLSGKCMCWIFLSILLIYSLFTDAVGILDIIASAIINLKSCGEKANFMYYPRNKLGKNEENYKNLIQEIRCAVRDSNQILVQYK